MRVLLCAFMVCSVAWGQGAEGNRYREAALGCLDALLEHGTDRYGEVETPILMSVIDVRTNESPEEPETFDSLIRTEDRLHRRNPAGGDLWDDQPLIQALTTATKLTGDAKYADAARDYVRAYFERAPKANGMLAWGSHVFYDAYRDAPGGDQDGAGPNETLVNCAEWATMWRAAPDALRKEIEGFWEWHVVDKETGLFNRHDDKQAGCDFAFYGGELVASFAFLAKATGDDEYHDWAKTISDRHWNARNPETNLAPDAPSTGDRYDAHHCFTTLPGPYAALLFQAYEISGEPMFRERALAMIEAYDRYGWDEDAQKFRGMLTLDGTPVMDQEKGEGYDVWKPTGYVDTWRSTMFSYEFPLVAAQTAVHIWQKTGDERAKRAAEHWAAHISADLPVQLGRRWKGEIEKAFPPVAEAGGGYAESYGRAASFFLAMHYATGDDGYLKTARGIADDAIAHLQEGPWLVGLPGKPYYESVDGVGFLLNALLELGSYPEQLSPNL